MTDLRRISVLAVVLVVLLRLSIGWQLLYEGLWKFNEQHSSQPWSAEGFLKNAEGPFRDVFRNLTGDPDDRRWLHYESVNDDWEDWQTDFRNHYELSETQSAALNTLLDGSPEYVGKVKLEKLPPDVEKLLNTSAGMKKAIKYDPGRKVLVVDGDWHLIPSEVATLKSKAPVTKNEFGVITDADPVSKAFHRALDDVNKRQSQLGYREKLRALLAGNADRLGPIEGSKENVGEAQAGEHQKYFQRLEEYEKLRAEADLDFEHRHTEFYKRRLQELRTELVGPVRGLEAQFKQAARNLLTTEQMARGPLPVEDTQMAKVDRLTMWLLMVLGAMLISGLGTRVAAVAAAGMLLSFYLAYPPWPGVKPPSVPTLEHSLFVDKNFIEVLALLAIAAMPTGTWFGVDGLIWRLVGGGKSMGNGGPRRPAISTAPSMPDVDGSRLETQRVTAKIKT